MSPQRLFSKKYHSLPWGVYNGRVFEEYNILTVVFEGVCPMLAQIISKVDLTRDMVELDYPGSDGFTNAMERQSRMALVELGVRLGGTLNNGLVASKHIALVADTDAKVSECKAEIDYLLHTCTGGDKFRAIRGSFDSDLFLREPIDRCLVHEVEDSCDKTTGEHIMVEV